MSAERATSSATLDGSRARQEPPTIPGELFPFRPNFLEMPGARMHFVDEGRGEPVVMLHGNPTWSFYYRDLILALRDDYRTVVPDHVGCGLSDKPGDDRYEYTLDRRVADLETLLDSLGLTSGLTLVLHDWGGMIGMAYASRHPERVKRLVVLNTAAFLLPPGKRLPFSLWLCRNTPLGALLVRGFNAFSRGAVRYCATRPLDPAVRAGYLAPYDSWANRVAVLRFVQDIPLGPGDPAYATVRSVEDGLDRLRGVPKLVCWGERDFVFDGSFLAEWQRRCPEAEVHRFPDAGHFVLEDAGAAIVPLVRDFLRRHPLSANSS
jgi:haloalkane dehalogenase